MRHRVTDNDIGRAVVDRVTGDVGILRLMEKRGRGYTATVAMNTGRGLERVTGPSSRLELVPGAVPLGVCTIPDDKRNVPQFIGRGLRAPHLLPFRKRVVKAFNILIGRA